MAKELTSATALLLGAEQKAAPTPAKAAKAAKVKEPAEAPAKATANNDIEMPPETELKTERTQILFKKSTKKALKKIAKAKTGGSLNDLVNRICEKYIAEHPEA